MRPFLLGFSKAKSITYVNDADDQMFINVIGTPRQCLSVSRNCNAYSSMIDQVFKKKILGKGIADMIENKDDLEQLEKMLKDGTKVEIIKTATREEKLQDGKTLWQKIKESCKVV